MLIRAKELKSRIAKEELSTTTKSGILFSSLNIFLIFRSRFYLNDFQFLTGFSSVARPMF
jgi:hypothetical protein